MTVLRLHRLWLGLLLLAIAIIAGRAPVLDFAGNRAARDLAAIKDARVKTENDLQQLRDDVVAARKLGSEIDRTRADQVLAPTDRLKAAVMLEKEAAIMKIARFTYTLAPEERTAIDAGGALQNLALSAVTLAGNAPDDISIYNFITHLQHVLPGRARLQQVTITRSASAEVPLAATNVHFEAALEWLSNGSLQTIAGRL